MVTDLAPESDAHHEPVPRGQLPPPLPQAVFATMKRNDAIYREIIKVALT